MQITNTKSKVEGAITNGEYLNQETKAQHPLDKSALSAIYYARTNFPGYLHLLPFHYAPQ